MEKMVVLEKTQMQTITASLRQFDFFSLPVNNFLKNEGQMTREFRREDIQEMPGHQGGLVVSLHEALAQAGCGEENY